MKTTFSLSVIFLIIIAAISCSDDSVSNSAGINYLAFESLGCQSREGLLKTNDAATIEWEFLDNNLKISTMFTTHCSAMMTDSVIVADEKIEIFLCDTCTTVARCICPQKEVFTFNAESKNSIEIVLYYKAITNDTYYELGKKTIEL